MQWLRNPFNAETVNVVHCNEQDRQCTYNVTLRGVRATIDAVEGQYYTFRVCVWGLCTRHAKRMRGFSFSFVASPSQQNLPALFHKRYNFRKKKVTGCKMGVLVFSTNLSETFPILRIIQ
jgi:hypothetical protein